MIIEIDMLNHLKPINSFFVLWQKCTKNHQKNHCPWAMSKKQPNNVGW